MPEIAFGNRSATLRISSDDGKKTDPNGVCFFVKERSKVQNPKEEKTSVTPAASTNQDLSFYK
jgi:hypothetical protein